MTLIIVQEAELDVFMDITLRRISNEILVALLKDSENGTFFKHKMVLY